jgi:hypothetical protein
MQRTPNLGETVTDRLPDIAEGLPEFLDLV